MVRIIPSEFDDTNKSEAEKLIFNVIKKDFDENWIVFYSYILERKDKELKLIDAEIDFLFLHKTFGILIMEVKGGQIRCIDGKWFQNNVEIKNPYKQALTNKYCIKNHLAKYLNAEPPVPISHCVCFPDTFSQDSDSITTHSEITINGSSINYLLESVSSIMQQQKQPEYETDKILFHTIKKALLPIFEFGYSLADKFGLEKRKVFSLTDRQCELLTLISEHKRALIKGCAGSGKTIMAVKKAKQLASEGKKILLLCYNQMLAENLAYETKEFPNINAATYHNLCVTELEKSGFNVEPEGDIKNFFQKEIPQKLLELITEQPIKYDAVIVDEGQDFLEDYWYTINELVSEDGSYYIFYDPDQNIYNSELRLPQLSTPFILNKNCRNTKNIFNELKNIINKEITIDIEDPEGEVVHYLKLPDNTQLRHKLSQILHDLVSNKNLKESQIVILGTHHLNHTSIGEDNKVGKFTLRENGPPDENIIPYYSCMKYKGLESDVVILLDYHDTRWNSSSTKYTAMSRARHLVYVLSK